MGRARKLRESGGGYHPREWQRQRGVTDRDSMEERVGAVRLCVCTLKNERPLERVCPLKAPGTPSLTWGARRQYKRGRHGKAALDGSTAAMQKSGLTHEVK